MKKITVPVNPFRLPPNPVSLREYALSPKELRILQNPLTIRKRRFQTAHLDSRKTAARETAPTTDPYLRRFAAPTGSLPEN